MAQRDRLSIATTLTKSRPPRLPFLDMKNAVLGPDYELSVVFVGDDRSRTLNREHRGKDKSTNILSFPLSENAGEIVINPYQARRDMTLFDMDERTFLTKLFIHGLLHLKGMRHSDTMERKEEQLLNRYASQPSSRN